MFKYLYLVSGLLEKRITMSFSFLHNWSPSFLPWHYPWSFPVSCLSSLNGRGVKCKPLKERELLATWLCHVAQEMLLGSVWRSQCKWMPSLQNKFYYCGKRTHIPLRTVSSTPFLRGSRTVACESHMTVLRLTCSLHLDGLVLTLQPNHSRVNACDSCTMVCSSLLNICNIQYVIQKPSYHSSDLCHFHIVPFLNGTLRIPFYPASSPARGSLVLNNSQSWTGACTLPMC